MDWRNYSFTFFNPGHALRVVLTFVGILLLSVGILIIVIPWVLQFLIGGTFIVVGALLLGAAWRRRQGPPPHEAGGESDVVDEWR